MECHGTDTQEADVNLSSFANERTFVENRRVWRRAMEMLQTSAMPPEDHLQPSDAERKAIARWIKQSLAGVDWSTVRKPGRVPMARMTRDEFQYAIQDLFGIPIELDRVLPMDPEGASGFTNDYTSLVMTGKQLRQYFKAAEMVAAAVCDQSASAPFSIHYEVEEGTNASWKKPVTQERDGSRGWKFSSKLGNKYQAVSKTLDFDRTGIYRLRVRAKSKGPGNYAAAWFAVDSVNDASREVGVLIEGKDLKTYETKLFITQGRHTLIFGYDFYGPLWLPEPPVRPQVKLGQSSFDPPPYDQAGMIPNGLELSDLEASGVRVPENQRRRAAELIAVINDGYFPAVLDNLMLHKFHFEKGYLPVFLGGLGYDYQQTVVPAFKELAKLTDVQFAQLEKVWKARQPTTFDALRKYAERQRLAWSKQDKSRKKVVGDLFIDWIKLDVVRGGQRIPRTAREVETYLDRILPRAIRRKQIEDEKKHFLEVYQEQCNEGAGHLVAFQRMLISILLSPQFLYRTDGPDETAGIHPLHPHPLAARLSSFLWSSIPDEKLLQIASSNDLTQQAEVEMQVDRMLADDRRYRLAQHFTAQWLNLTDIGLSKEPDKELFRYFSWHLAEDMRKEVALNFDRILKENRSILELIHGDETHLNERLARLYGIENVSGNHFRRVKIPDQQRGGLLGTAAVLTSTSLATRTSPVRRGQFVLETLLGEELPGPPPDVPELNKNAGQNRELSLRESLAQHRNNSRCVGCHNRIDPMGFALENYDWIGRWRDKDPAGPVDSRVRLPDNQVLNGANDLRRFIAEKRRDQFTSALARALLKYALGRDLDYYDEDAVRRIVANVKADGFKSRTLIKAIAVSYPFRFREIKLSKK